MNPQSLTSIRAAASEAFGVAFAHALRVSSGSMPRPPLPDDEKHDRKIEVRLTKSEHAIVVAAAKLTRDRTASAWARNVLIDAARALGVIAPPAPAQAPRKKSRPRASR